MDSTQVLSLLEQLDDEIDDLEDSLSPLVKTALSETTSKLPLLDKAKLYVLVTYAIESILFSHLRLNGVKAREHPVFLELTRVKQYFEKIKNAEAPKDAVEKRATIRLNVPGAARVIRAGLAGNDKHDLDRAEQQAKERATTHIKFQEISRHAAKRRAETEEAPQIQAEESGLDSSDSDSGSHSSEAEAPAEPPRKKLKAGKSKSPNNEVSGKSKKKKGPGGRGKKAGKKNKEPNRNHINMPRQGRSGGGRSGGFGGSSRPTAARKPAPKQQVRPATTAASPTASPATAAPPQQSSNGSGLFGQMASTAAGVAVGSSIGHAIGGFFGGGSSQPAETQDSAVASQGQQDQNASANSWGAGNCDVDLKAFSKCMDENNGNMPVCNWYLEQFKACQQAAKQY
ncbi:hypothetical protein B7494_g6181 [Chlorociboria aeruginascens]|nr:hypothetical protein B7494_g6181 [Chlorociboria aeruginascens]